jgi:hypothetical protein
MTREPFSWPVIGTVAVLVAFFFTSLPLGNVLTAGETQGWDTRKADAEILRLKPSAFPELPRSVARELVRRGCLIPQVEPWADRLHNVISGQFRKADQTDWAILCSVDGVSSLLIFWNGSAADVENLIGERRPDRVILQSKGDHRLGFNWLISAAGKKCILDHYALHGMSEPPPINHEGIDSAFVGKASTIFYWYQSAWIQLPGAD